MITILNPPPPLENFFSVLNTNVNISDVVTMAIEILEVLDMTSSCEHLRHYQYFIEYKKLVSFLERKFVFEIVQ
jgi:hypothetical protein